MKKPEKGPVTGGKDKIMKWKKIGLLFKPGKFTWMSHHTFISTVDKLKERNLYKIYFCGRDKTGMGRIGYAILDLTKEPKIAEISDRPILELGKIGTFDDSGMMPCSIVDRGREKYLYYYGISLSVLAPWRAAIGLAISKDDGRTFDRFSEAPIFNINKYDIYGVAQPYVMYDNGKWKLWYVSFTDWMLTRNMAKPKHYFLIKYTESDNGIDWKPSDTICLNYGHEEYAITRPTLYKEDGLYKMWFSYRAAYNNYNIGYAESSDGISWNRLDDKAGIYLSDSGWDDEMLCHAFVFKHDGVKYMVYNGNGYGKTGTGLAVLEKE